MLEQLGVLKQSENADYNDLEKYEASATVELLPKDKVYGEDDNWGLLYLQENGQKLMKLEINSKNCLNHNNSII